MAELCLHFTSQSHLVKQSFCVALDGFELAMSLLPLLPHCWDCRKESPCLANTAVFLVCEYWELSATENEAVIPFPCEMKSNLHGFFSLLVKEDFPVVCFPLCFTLGYLMWNSTQNHTLMSLKGHLSNWLVGLTWVLALYSEFFVTRFPSFCRIICLSLLVESKFQQSLPCVLCSYMFLDCVNVIRVALFLGWEKATLRYRLFFLGYN